MPRLRRFLAGQPARRGVVVSNEIDLTHDVEALAVENLERTGAIEYYR